MTSTISKLINNKFGGIRRKSSSFSNELISCSDCENVELFFTELNSGIGIRTVKGNKNVTKYTPSGGTETSLIPSDEEVIEMFETIQDGIRYTLIYTESEDDGTLYKIDIDNKTITSLVTGLSVTGKACGIDMSCGYTDYFIFSNSKQIKYIYTDTTTHIPLQVKADSAISFPTNPITGTALMTESNRNCLGLKVFDSRLWFFSDKVLYYSEKADCTNFVPSGQGYDTDAGYIEFVKGITAIHNYLGSLAVFHNDSSSLVTVDSTTGFVVGEESPGGCASYRSLVFHGTDLYFYDDTKKGVFSFKQIVNGDKTLGDNIALDLQNELTGISPFEVDDIKALSVVTSDRNEVWFLVPISDEVNRSCILIYDYLRGEWIKRKSQLINTASIINSELYSAGAEIYQEYSGDTFDGTYIPSYYNCSIFNFGEDNSMKITKFPPRITVDGNYMCKFYVKYIKNYQLFKNPKIKYIQTKQQANVLIYDNSKKWNDGWIYQSNALTTIVKLPSTTFKTLEMQFYTQATETGYQQFAIKSIEFSKIKVKQV